MAAVRATPSAHPRSRGCGWWATTSASPHLLVNVPVFSLGGRFLGYPDLLDPEAGLALEYDGAGHRSVSRQRSDNLREEALRAHGVEVLRVTSLDLLRPVALGRRLLGVRARCAFLRRTHGRGRSVRRRGGARPAAR